MRYATLDNIVRSTLMQCGYPIHWYIDALKFGSDCLRELTFDSLQNVNTILLPVDTTTNVVDLPCDFVDLVKIGTQQGQYVKPLVKKNSINRLKNLDNTGTPIPYSIADDSSDYVPLFYESDYVSDQYEPLGRLFGFNARWIQDGYTVLRERGQIQLDQLLDTDEIYIEYISDGQDSDNATRIHPYAQKTIESYIMWQFKEHSRAYGAQDRQLAKNEFSNQRRLLRARLNDLTADDIKRIVRGSYSAAPKG